MAGDSIWVRNKKIRRVIFWDVIMRRLPVVRILLTALFILGMAVPFQARGEEKAPRQVMSFVMGTPVSLGLGL
jgi:hypothetical protein